VPDLEAVPAEHKLHNSGVLASLEEGQVLLGLRGHSRQGHIIVVMRWRLLRLVMQALLAVLAAGFSVHEGLVVRTALVVCSVTHNLGEATHQQELCNLQTMIRSNERDNVG